MLSLLICVDLCFYGFFFSSRRRHTRCLSDWSSDVCSSDLGPPAEDSRRLDAGVRSGAPRNQGAAATVADVVDAGHGGTAGGRWSAKSDHADQAGGARKETAREEIRSEERRVGKECRARRKA